MRRLYYRFVGSCGRALAEMLLSRPGSGWEPLVRRVVPNLAEQPLGSMLKLLDLVCEWNARTDLTAARSAEELVDLYLGDAVIIARHAAPGERWVDVGSGAGAPAIPLALLVSELELTLVEPRGKRVAFLRSALGAIGRTDVRVERARSQELAPALFDVAISRATLPPEEWLAEGARLARSAVWVLLARGAAPTLPGWRTDLELAYNWPLTRADRRALRYLPEKV
jgi:16S rRNA (guanine527-N7)-methyltransferase